MFLFFAFYLRFIHMTTVIERYVKGLRYPRTVHNTGPGSSTLLILFLRPRNEQTTFFQITGINEVSRLETQPLDGNLHPNPLLPSIQDDIFHGKPIIEPPSYDLPPPSYDEVMKSNKV